jgi:hypothetical protein
MSATLLRRARGKRARAFRAIDPKFGTALTKVNLSACTGIDGADNQ